MSGQSHTGTQANGTRPATRDSTAEHSGYERTVPWLELFQDHCQPKKDVPFETPWKDGFAVWLGTPPGNSIQLFSTA